MKTQLALLTLVSAFTLQPSALRAQGSLTPPGAPAPTMKSLDQIEPRTIVNAVNTPGDANNLFIISQPGSYYLTTNIVCTTNESGIEITAYNVTLDLDGFSLRGISFANDGINIPNASTNITVRNGTISGWGGYGVYAPSPYAANLVFERLNVSANSYGIYLLGSGVVRDCNIKNNFYIYGYGIQVTSGTVSGCDVLNNSGGGIYVGSGTVSGCSAQNNGYDGIDVGSGTVSDCTVENNTQNGIVLYAGTVSDCTVVNNGGYGVYLNPGTASGCFVNGNKYSGIYVVGNGSDVIGNTCIGNNTSGSTYDGGIFMYGNNNRVEDNHVTASGNTGIAVASIPSGYTNNVIIKNSVSGNGANNYNAPAGNDLGPVGTAATATSPWANISH